MAANNAMFMAFWAILFEAIEAPIRGYTFTDVMFLWAVAATGFGLGSIVCGNAAYLSRIIYQGDLDVYLTQPKPVLPNLLASRMSVSSWGDLLYGLGLFAFSQPLTPAGIGLFLLFVLLAAGVLVAVRVLYHSLTFLLGNAEDLAGVGSEQIINFSLYPGTIFDGPVVAVILHTLIPAALVAHLPAELFRAVARGMGLDWGLLAAIVGGDAALIAAAWVVFALGPAPLRVRQPHRRPHLTWSVAAGRASLLPERLRSPEQSLKSRTTPSLLLGVHEFRAGGDVACEVRREGPLQRLTMVRREEADLHMIVHNPLQRHPPWCDPQRVPDLLGDDDFALLSYYVRHGRLSLNITWSIRYVAPHPSAGGSGRGRRGGYPTDRSPRYRMRREAVCRHFAPSTKNVPTRGTALGVCHSPRCGSHIGGYPCSSARDGPLPTASHHQITRRASSGTR